MFRHLQKKNIGNNFDILRLLLISGSVPTYDFIKYLSSTISGDSELILAIEHLPDKCLDTKLLNIVLRGSSYHIHVSTYINETYFRKSGRGVIDIFAYLVDKKKIKPDMETLEIICSQGVDSSTE